jgi:hypothetical protein
LAAATRLCHQCQPEQCHGDNAWGVTVSTRSIEGIGRRLNAALTAGVASSAVLRIMS